MAIIELFTVKTTLKSLNISSEKKKCDNDRTAIVIEKTKQEWKLKEWFHSVKHSGETHH